jgi:tetratricopeptide (TPR) repeat protein
MDYSTPRRSGLNRYCALAVSLILVLSIGLLPIQIQASLSALHSGSNARIQGDLKPQQLERGKPIERELAGGQSHFYKITVTPGQYLNLEVDQRGIDLVVVLYAPDGKKETEATSLSRGTGLKTLIAIAETSGTYSIEVRSDEKTAKLGRYEIEVKELKEATAKDKYLVAAESVFQKADELAEGTSEEKRRSIDVYYEALGLYRKAGDSQGIVDTLNRIGKVYWILGEMQKVLDSLNEALLIIRSIGDRYREAATLNNIALIYRSLGEMRKAVDIYNEALPIVRAVGDRSGEATVLTNIGNAFNALGELQNALNIYSEALLMSRAMGDRSGEAHTLNNIGAVYDSLGEAQKALDSYNEALSIRRAAFDRRGEATTLSNIGVLYQSLGEMQKALEKYNEALPIIRAIGERNSEAVTLNNIGAAYRSLGEMQKALDRFSESLLIRRATGDRMGEATTLNNIGTVHQSLGEMQKALNKYNESVSISRAIGDRRLQATTLYNIGRINDSLGEIKQALENHSEALTIRRTIGDRGGEAESLLGIARVEQKRGDLTQALQTIDQAITIVESLRANIGSSELRASYSAYHYEFYESKIDVLMQMHLQKPNSLYDAAALVVSERARARSLLELLTEARAEFRQGIDGSLLERKRSLQQRLTAKSAAQIKLLNRKHTPAQAAAAAKEIASLTIEYDELETQIRISNPRYAALTQSQPLTLSEIQQQVLDPETLLLEYSLGDQASYLFVVSPTSITSYQLPKRSEIEAATWGVREMLIAPQPRPDETAVTRRDRIKEAGANYWPQAAALSRMLLGPAASQLGAKRLLIVADGALQYLPFGALPVPEIEGDRATGRRGDGAMGRLANKATGRRIDEAIVRNGKSSPPRPVPVPSTGREPSKSPRRPAPPTPLIVEHEIIHLPSASTLAVLRRELAGRKPAPKAVAVIADPVFSADDARVKLAGFDHNVLASKQTPSELARALTDVRGELTRLLMTRDEAQAILSITPPNVRLEALDFRASRATSTSDELSQYRIVHFATHGLLNSQHPKLSGLVLSLVDERGQPQDGFLQFHEIFNLRLPAELVVLSACQTGLGKEVRGEGLVGLTRGFMYAGAARVMASLWQVNDAATAELMKRFYRQMLQEGMRPAAALRAAQIEMWKRPQWESPYYWGAFVLQGEWK